MKEKDKAPLDVSRETKVILGIFTPVKEDLENFITENQYPFYAILLGRDTDTFLKDYVANNWINLHYMSGNNCLFLSIYPPKQVDEEIIDYWKKKLGDKFDNVLDKIPAPAWSYEYGRNLGIPFEKLPCLFLGINLKKDEGLVLKIPEWSEKDMTSLFEFIFDKINNASGLNENERLKRIEEEIDKLYSLKLAKIYIKNNWIEYVKPKEIVQKSIELIIAGIFAGIKRGIGV
ncbi:MAG: hypothetical protein STSR0008_24090 [Ignavibacterium sp.]